MKTNIFLECFVIVRGDVIGRRSIPRKCTGEEFSG